MSALRRTRAPTKSARRAGRHVERDEGRRHGVRRAARHAVQGRRRLLPLTAIFLGTAVAGSGAYAVTQWVVSLGSGSSGLAEGAKVKNIEITAVSSPSPSNLLYPHGTGDVVLKITNPNPFPVTITTLDVPSTSTFATGFSTSGLSSSVAACDASSSGSDVYWHFATAAPSTSHALTTPLVVAGTGSTGDPLTVTLTGAATMGTTAASACEGQYFQMPPLKGVVAYAGGNVAPTASPASDS